MSMSTSIDKMLFRQIAGSFASGVTVVTTGGDGEYHGMTASAFSSLSLEPPLVLVCVDRTAATLPYLQASGAFNISILTDAQEQISRQFAAKDSPQSRLEDTDHHLGANGIPILDNCLAYFECRVVSQYDGGDHIIFVGEVTSGALGDSNEPLLYYRSAYRRLAP
jgi:flavin reductase (DIM6/NTAB) family NADH-FMN oxidoreductase RutF